MTEDEQQPDDVKPTRRHRKHRPGAGLTATLLLAVVVLSVAALVLSGRPVPVPGVIQSALLKNVNSRVDGFRFDVDALSFSVVERDQPQVLLRGLTVSAAGGATVAALNEVRADMSLGALLQGTLSADRIVLDGAQITLRRARDGSFAVQSGVADPNAAEALSPADVLAGIDAAFDAGPLAAIGEVEARGVVITLEDARTGRIWQAANAQLALRERPAGLSLSVSSDVFNGTDDLASVQISAAFDDATRDISVGFRVVDMPARDIALQTPALAWLEVLDAPISGAVRANVSGNGRLVSLDGTLDLSEGVIRPEAARTAIPFDTARAYFAFDPKRGRLDFAEIGVVSPNLRLTASGHTYLASGEAVWSDTFVGQFNVSEVVVRSDAAFESPVRVDRARADLKLVLDPFRVDLADVLVENGEVRARARGAVTLQDGQWRVDVDASSQRIDKDRVIGFWPAPLAPKTRGWLSENVLEAELKDVSFAVRYVQGRKPDLSLSFDYADTSVRYLRHLPSVSAGAGRATLLDRKFVIAVEEGVLAGSDGRTVDGSGTVFTIPDTRERPARGDVSITARGDLGDILEIIDRPPLRLLERAGRDANLAEAEAVVEARVVLPLKDGLRPPDIDFEVEAVARGVTSDSLVPGRQFSSDSLTLRATKDGLGVDGSGRLDGVPFDAAWRLPLGSSSGGGSRVTGEVELSAEALTAFGIVLPPGTVRGATDASYEIELGGGEAPRLSLVSDLRGMALGIPALGWNKPSASRGGFELGVTLGEVPDVTRLNLSAPGLALSGDVDFGGGGNVETLRLRQLRIGNWLDARARVSPGSGGSPPRIAIESGRLDLRAVPDGGGGGGGTPGAPIDLTLDSVIVSDGITLAPFSGRVRPLAGGLDGTFEARLAGQTRVRGVLTPAFGRTALRLEADNAGGVLRDIGLSPNAEGGSFYLVMTPVAASPAGTLDGEFLIEDIRFQDAPVLAGLLNAISVVGLLDQLGSGGLSFDTVDGAFRVRPDRITLRNLAAVGPSLGISAEGIYDPASKVLDMQGVVSPIYFVNSIGALLTRRGEGLFGFSYRLSGPTSGPTISVNPLSILTPGMFREIFRRPMPTE